MAVSYEAAFLLVVIAWRQFVIFLQKSAGNYKCLFSQASNKLENHAAGSAEEFLFDHLQNSSLAVDHDLVYFAVARE